MQKLIILSLLFLSTYSFAQSLDLSCNKYIYRDTDLVTNKVTLSSKKSIKAFNQITKENIEFILVKAKGNNIVFAFYVTRNKSMLCIDKDQKINILFTDNTRLELLNEDDFNCKGEATIYLGDLQELNELSTKKIKIIRVATQSSYCQFELNEIQSNDLMTTFNCLLSN